MLPSVLDEDGSLTGEIAHEAHCRFKSLLLGSGWRLKLRHLVEQAMAVRKVPVERTSKNMSQMITRKPLGSALLNEVTSELSRHAHKS
jgi:hypothetical protein